MFSFNQKTRITGIGSALVDLLIHETEDFLEDLGKEKGGMTLVDHTDIQAILEKTTQKPKVVSGGAACNTIVGVGKLGGDARFIGTRGNDVYGDVYEQQLMASNVEPVFGFSGLPTGMVLSVITPDAQRSMFTYLGASTEHDPVLVTPECFSDTAIAMIEGYLLFNPDLIMAALKSAKTAGAVIALDLASFEVVNNSRAILDDIIRDYVDILIANEDEAKAYTTFSDEAKALDGLSEDVAMGVLKVGKRGSFIKYQGQVIRIAPKEGPDAVDTTGAGDLWAAGFLYGLSHGYGIEKSGMIGSECGFEVCQIDGAHIPQDGWQRILRRIHAFS